MIVEHTEESFDVWDFCFIANASLLSQVTHNQRIRVKYYDIAGAKHGELFEGYFSELLQHEVDHLNRNFSRSHQKTRNPDDGGEVGQTAQLQSINMKPVYWFDQVLFKRE